MPILTGTPDHDFIIGTSEDDLIEGLGGDDILVGAGGNDIIYGGEGNDNVNGGTGVDMIYGGAGDDQLRNSPGPNEAGELIDGGDGVDLLTFSANPGSGGITFSLADPSVDQVIDGVTLRNIERVVFGGSDGNDSLTGGALVDRLNGGRGDDVLHGGGGDDDLHGGESGQDQLFGDEGDDTLTLFHNLLLDGGAGVDLAVIDFSGGGGSGGPLVELDVSDPSVDQFVAGATIRNVERLDYEGSGGIDRITGGAYEDHISGRNGDDVLRGGGGNDTLSGGDGIDQLFGDGGDDYLHSLGDGDSPGDSLLDGGDGFDLLELSIIGYSGSTTIDLNASDRVRNVEKLTFRGGTGVNKVTGAGAADIVTGNSSGDEFRGLGGDDIMSGAGGDDLLYGGEGNDRLTGDAGADTMYGEEGNDSLRDSGLEGNLMDGGIGNDELTGGRGDDTLIGGEGDDYLDGAVGADMMTGGVGNDFYLIDALGDVATELAGEGVDEIRTTLASYTLGDTFENLSGGTNSTAPQIAHRLTGNALDNAITGNRENDRLDGAGGADVLRGLSGDDSYFVDNAADRVFELANLGYDVVYASVSFALAAGQHVEVLATIDNTATTAINLTGNELANYLVGNAGSNLLDGGAGPDQLWGRGGDNSYYADAGDDVVEYEGDGYDILYARSSYGLGVGQSIEVLATIDNTATTAINLIGNALNNYIVGNAGANTLDGGGGSDQLWGREGDDSYIADGNDLIIEYAGQGNDILYAQVSYILADGLSIETLATADNNATTAINLTGNALDNYVTGNAGANILDGGTGADLLWGRGGDDSYFVDSDDIVVEYAGEGHDIVYARSSHTLSAGMAVEVLATVDNNATTALNLTGNELDNYVTGNAGANVLDGGAGADQLFGRGGADSFAFTTALGGGNVDTIVDFVSGTDRIALDDAIFAGIGTPGSFNADAFFAGTAAHDADDRIVYDQATGQLFYDADGSGAGAAVLFALVAGAPAIAASDFTVI